MEVHPRLATFATSTVSGCAVELLIDDSRTHAFLNVLRTDASKEFDAAAILQFLIGQRVSLSDEARARIGSLAGPIQRLPVAEGRAPIAGSDAGLTWIVKDPSKRLVATEDRIDFHKVSEFVNVSAGEPICVFSDPEPGRAGIDVFGRELPAAKGRRAPVRLGGKVRLAADGRTVEARSDGCLRLAGGTISVEDVYAVKADVDYSVGNIDFNGQVIVNGSVLDGFTVRAARDISVRGGVSAAGLEAGGEIAISGGVTGHEKGVLRAQGGVAARYLENVTVEAGGDVHVQTEIINCTVRSGGSVIVDRGRIIGGRTTAAGDVKVGVLGSAMCVATSVEAGVDVLSEARLTKLAAEHSELAAQIRRIEHAVGPLVQDPARIATLPPEKGEALRKLLAELEGRRANAGVLEKEIEALSKPAEGAEYRASVAVTRKLFPNVAVRIGPSFSRPFADEVSGPIKLRAVPEKGSIEVFRGA